MLKEFVQKSEMWNKRIEFLTRMLKTLILHKFSPFYFNKLHTINLYVYICKE